MNKFEQLCEQLEIKIVSCYEQGVTMEEAERLASEFLYGQIAVSKELKSADLDTRMKKSGLKAIRAAIYMEAATKSDKKPSDTMLEQIVVSDEIVMGEQRGFDTAEVYLASLERYYSIFQNAHIHFRGVAKGRFDG